MATEDPMVAALLRERAALVQSGLTDRVADVDEQLKANGYEPDGDSKPSTRSTTPKGRKTRSSETT